MRLRILLLAALAVSELQASAAPHPEAGLPFFDTWEPREYGGHTQVWSAAQDRAGVMHFGNLSRVLSFDGAHWGYLDVPNASWVRALAVDAKDTLWVGGVNELGFAVADATGRRAFTSLRDQLPPAAREFGELWRVHLTPRGPLFQSNTWLLRWDGRQFATLPLPAPSGGWQSALAGDTVWVAHPKHGWATLADDGAKLSLVPQERPEAFAGASLNFAVPGAREGEWIFGTARAGLVRWDGKSFAPFPTPVDALLKEGRAYRACPLPGGRFAVTTLQGGAFLFDTSGALIARLNDANGLPDNTVINAAPDSRGGLWLCLERGLARVDARPWLTWFGPSSGAPRAQLAVRRFQHVLYVAGSAAGLLRLAPAAAGGNLARLEPTPGLREYLLAVEDAGDALIGLATRGFIAWRPGDRAAVLLPGDMLNAQGFLPAARQPGRWFALADGQIHTFRREGEQWLLEGRVPNLDNVRSLMEDPDGAWWFGLSEDGAARATFPSPTATSPGAPVITRFGRAQGLPAGHGWTRVMLIGGRPLLTCERGLFRFDPAAGRFTPTDEFGARFADGTTTARTLAQDPRGGVWIAARAAGQAELVTPIDLGLADARGWHPLRLPQLARLDDVADLRLDGDALWIGGHGGLIRVDVAQWRAAPPEAPPRVALGEATAGDGAPLPLASGWELPWARRSLRVRFAAPALARDPQALYETTLLGAGSPVQLADASSERSFAALGTGAYRLQVRARGSDGRWSDPVTLAFAVLPPWWLSGWAMGGYLVGASLVVAAGVRRRTRALERRAAQLEATVAERTEELRRSNVELSRLHQLELDEKIAARLGEEKARLEVLRYQLNPHFLFNALASVRAQLPATMTEARDTIGQLTEFCRSTLLRPAGDGQPTVAQEMETISAYLAIEKTRWGDLLDARVEIDPAAAERRVPPLLLLPLVENALKYGRATSPDTLGLRLAARIDESSDALLIEVANTGEWVQPEARGDVPSLGIGMENLRQRLHRFYPDAHALHVESATGWVTVRLRLGQAERGPSEARSPG